MAVANAMMVMPVINNERVVYYRSVACTTGQCLRGMYLLVLPMAGKRGGSSSFPNGQIYKFAVALNREKAAGMYSPRPFAAAQGIVEMPYLIVQVWKSQWEPYRSSMSNASCLSPSTIPLVC